MNPLENFRIAARALRVNKLRSMLTVLGIVIGVAAVVCMVSVGAGAQVDVSEKIRTLGANLLMVTPGAQNTAGARQASGTQPTLTEEDAAAIRREFRDVLAAAPLLSRSMPLVAANKNWVTLTAGINPDYLVAREWQITAGRSFTSTEVESGAKVAVIGSVIADELFDGRAPIGEAFRIGNVPFTVIGVLDKKGLGAAGRSQDDIAFIPLSSAKSRVLGAVRGTTRDALDLILVKLADAAAMEGMQSEIETLLRQRHRIRDVAPSDFDPEPRRCADRAGSGGAYSRHTVDRGGIRFADRRRHQHYEHHAGVSNRAHARDRLAHGGGRPPRRYSPAVLDRGPDFGIDRRPCRRWLRSRRRHANRLASRLAHPNQPLGHPLCLRLRWAGRDLVRPLPGASRRQTRSNCGVAL